MHAFLMSTGAGGDFVTNEKERSAYTVMMTGMISPMSPFVRSLNSFVKLGIDT